ncbi:MAG: UDP-N-acetylmuramate dehydrogenase, partial [Firmicutes bacterium]|nr:UDP-N-acetylmuramate dehydrogenase [Bacillota bacterium]
MRELAESLARDLRGEVRWQEPLCRYTSFRIGGPADVLVLPASIEDVIKVRKAASAAEVPLAVIGGGSNLLVADAGVRGIVMRIGRGLSRVVWRSDGATVGAGAPLPGVAKEAGRRSLAGLEFACGIPGTVGGALAMNAGAHDGCMADVVTRVLAVDGHGRLVELEPEDMAFGYRTSRLLQDRDLVAVETDLRITPGRPDQIREKMAAYLEKRRRTQPLGTKNAGSIFKNPPGDFAGRLVEQAGCKGLSVGDAVVSPVHANFIV